MPAIKPFVILDLNFDNDRRRARVLDGRVVSVRTIGCRMERSGRRRTTGWVVYRLPRRGVRGTAGTALAGHANTTPAERLTNGSLGRWVV